MMHRLSRLVSVTPQWTGPGSITAMEGKITAVAFDLGGVLIDWNPRHLYRQLFGEDELAMERFLAEVCTPEWNGRFDAGRPFAEGVAELAAAYPEHAALIAAYHTRWAEMLGLEFAETVTIVRELKSAGYRTFALSNWSAETFPLTRLRYAFLEEFEGIEISGEVGVRKPNPAIFRHFLDRFGLKPEATVFIDDWDRNIAAATQVGLVAVHFVNADRLRNDLRRLGLSIDAG